MISATDTNLINRLKRSPNSCDYDYRPRYWPPPPPPPPPPYWPPPPPPGPPPPGPPPFWRHRHHHHDRFEDFTDDGPKDQPCSTCQGDGISSAISNAKSENGDAIAVAIAKATPNTKHWAKWLEDCWCLMDGTDEQRSSSYSVQLYVNEQNWITLVINTDQSKNGVIRWLCARLNPSLNKVLGYSIKSVYVLSVM